MTFDPATKRQKASRCQSVNPPNTRFQIVLMMFVLMVFFPWKGFSKIVYIDNVTGDDQRQGTSLLLKGEEGPVRTFERAMKLVQAGDLLWIVPNQEPYREPLRLSVQGKPDAPITIEGNGASIDVGKEISEGRWTPAGDYWSIPFDQKLDNQSAFMFYRGIPIARPRKLLGPGELAPDFTVIDGEAGRLNVRFPKGMAPPFKGAYLTSGFECVGFTNAQHLIIRNLHVRGTFNDGFGFHGSCSGIVIEHCTAILCGDEGASAHGKSQAEFRDCLFAWNGSWSGGVTDVHETQTRYLRCISAFGRGAGFSLRGAGHQLIDSYAFGNDPAKRTENSSEKVQVTNLVEISDPVKAMAEVRRLAVNNPQMARLAELAQEIGWGRASD